MSEDVVMLGGKSSTLHVAGRGGKVGGKVKRSRRYEGSLEWGVGWIDFLAKNFLQVSLIAPRTRLSLSIRGRDSSWDD